MASYTTRRVCSWANATPRSLSTRKPCSTASARAEATAARLEPHHPGHHAGRRGPGHGRHRLQHRPHLVGGGVDPSAQDLLQAGQQIVGQGGRPHHPSARPGPAPSPPVPPSRSRSAIGHGRRIEHVDRAAQHLQDHVRIAVAEARHPGQLLARQVDPVQLGRRQLAHVVEIEGPQHLAARTRLGLQLAQPLPHGGRLLGLLAPVAEADQHVGVDQAVAQLHQHRHGVVVTAVDVLQHHHRRLGARPGPAAPAPDASVVCHRSSSGRARAGDSPGVGSTTGPQPLEHGGRLPQPHPRQVGGQPLAPDPDSGRLQRLPQAVVRVEGTGHHVPTHQHLYPAPLGRLRHLHQQAALADAVLALHQHQATLARHHVVDPADQGRPLRPRPMNGSSVSPGPTSPPARRRPPPPAGSSPAPPPSRATVPPPARRPGPGGTG